MHLQEMASLPHEEKWKSKNRKCIFTSTTFASFLLLLFVATTTGQQQQQQQQQNRRLFSEGGSYSAQLTKEQEEEDKSSSTAAVTSGEEEDDSSLDLSPQLFMDSEYEKPQNLYRTESVASALAAQEEQLKRQRLANIIEQLRRQQQAPSRSQMADFAVPPVLMEGDEPVLNPDEPRSRNRNAEELEELRRLGMAFRQMSDLGAEEQPPAKENNQKMLTPVKKGQSEFVEFAEPIEQDAAHSKRLKDLEWMEKRVPSDSGYSNEYRRRSAFRLFGSGNILFIAYLAVCCVGVVAGTVGGVYYYNHIRSPRNDDPFNEFTRYSPPGPGKDKLKRGGQAFGQTADDDALAYKAQLQQYRQQKQKILGADCPVTSGEQPSDNEEDNDELEHNFSVFECPGLAPTGDVEIQNPNFVGDNGNVVVVATEAKTTATSEEDSAKKNGGDDGSSK